MSKDFSEDYKKRLVEDYDAQAFRFKEACQKHDNFQRKRACDNMRYLDLRFVQVGIETDTLSLF